MPGILEVDQRPGRCALRGLHPLARGRRVNEDGWLMMPRCQSVEVDETMRDEVRCVLGLGDVHDYNLGLLEDRAVILDYGTQDESGPVILISEASADDERVLANAIQ